MSEPLTFGSLFAGIGGIDLGLERAGMACRWQVENDEYCQRVLQKHWPGVGQWDDVRTFPPPPTEDWQVDLICGGFPCQDLSSANVKSRNGLVGEQSGLWGDFHRAARVIQPRWLVIENSPVWGDWVPSVRRDLWEIGFASLPVKLCPSRFGAPHKRPRCFVVAHADQKSKPLCSLHEEVARLCQSAVDPWNRGNTASCFVGMDDGIPARVDRLRGLGNAVVPQVAEWIGRQILTAAAERAEESADE